MFGNIVSCSDITTEYDRTKTVLQQLLNVHQKRSQLWVSLFSR
jgi:hypothetical protein